MKNLIIAFIVSVLLPSFSLAEPEAMRFMRIGCDKHLNALACQNYGKMLEKREQHDLAQEYFQKCEKVGPAKYCQDDYVASLISKEQRRDVASVGHDESFKFTPIDGSDLEPKEYHKQLGDKYCPLGVKPACDMAKCLDEKDDLLKCSMENGTNRNKFKSVMKRGMQEMQKFIENLPAQKRAAFENSKREIKNIKKDCQKNNDKFCPKALKLQANSMMELSELMMEAESAKRIEKCEAGDLDTCYFWELQLDANKRAKALMKL